MNSEKQGDIAGSTKCPKPWKRRKKICGPKKGAQRKAVSTKTEPTVSAVAQQVRTPSPPTPMTPVTPPAHMAHLQEQTPSLPASQKTWKKRRRICAPKKGSQRKRPSTQTEPSVPAVAQQLRTPSPPRVAQQLRTPSPPRVAQQLRTPSPPRVAQQLRTPSPPRVAQQLRTPSPPRVAQQLRTPSPSTPTTHLQGQTPSLPASQKVWKKRRRICAPKKGSQRKVPSAQVATESLVPTPTPTHPSLASPQITTPPELPAVTTDLLPTTTDLQPVYQWDPVLLIDDIAMDSVEASTPFPSECAKVPSEARPVQTMGSSAVMQLFPSECAEVPGETQPAQPLGNSDNGIQSKPSFEYESSRLSALVQGFSIISKTKDKIVVAKFYDFEVTVVKFAVTWFSNWDLKLYAHDREVTRGLSFWEGLPETYETVSDVCMVLNKLNESAVCVGNPDEDMLQLSDGTSASGAYRHEYQASIGDLDYSSSLRDEHCHLVISGLRCIPCQKLRCRLRSKRARRLSQGSKEPSKCKANALLNAEEKDKKLKELAKTQKALKKKISRLEEKVACMNRRAAAMIQDEGEDLGRVDSSDMMEMLKESTSAIEELPPDSFQRILLEQQLKYNSLKNKSSMRWHPAVVRWCLYIRSKSAKAYDGLRSCLALPSQRTLYDYSHYTETGTGFHPLVTEQLIEEASKKGLFEEEYKTYVGVVQDEVRIKQDLVYNKHTGELVGYIDLDSVSNELLSIDEAVSNGDRKIAKYVLVIMVRGICSNLEYPLAAFATEGITADFLYPIIWEAIEIIQLIAGLNVLYVCCDGATPNRKFFTMHSETRDKNTYKTENPFSNHEIYFISDPPHLLKTVRNCFSNSFAHKQSRHLWNQDTISWQDIRQLYEAHCTGTYRLAKTLRPEHVYLTSFSVMKVNLAAQVMSKNVADALEHVYGDRMSATVRFIRMINKWFDIMNSRNLNEARRKRNDDVLPFSSVDDARFTWLLDEFLPYFSDWEANVNARYPHLPKCERAAKQLSHQTLNGLRITTKSVVECTRFLLSRGAQFVMTEHLNQDPLERHFSHYRHKGGANENPSLFEVNNIINQVRAVSTQAMAPRRGNVQANLLAQLNHAPLPRRKRPHNAM